MSRGKAYGEKDKQEARFLLACGNSTEEVAKATHIPRTTIADWYKKWQQEPEFLELRRKNLSEMEGDLMRIQHKSLSLIERKLQDALDNKEEMGAQTANIIFGTAFDKTQLLRGSNTQNIGVQGIEDLLKKVSTESEF